MASSETLQPQAPGLPLARSLPLDAVAARLGCLGAEAWEAKEPLREIEERLTRSRFTGLVCVDYWSGEALTLYLADGVALGAVLETPYGDVAGEDALDAAEALSGPATVHAAGLPLGEAAGYA